MLRVCQRTRGIHGNDLSREDALEEHDNRSHSRGYEGGDRWDAEALALEDRNLKGNRRRPRVLCDY